MSIHAVFCPLCNRVHIWSHNSLDKLCSGCRRREQPETKWFYVPDSPRYESMDTCKKRHGSAQLVCHHSLLDDLENVTAMLEKTVQERERLMDLLGKAEESLREAIEVVPWDKKREYVDKLGEISRLRKLERLLENENGLPSGR